MATPSNLARVYTDANAKLGRGWYDYENSTIQWSSPEKYEIISRLGGGKYSEVFEAVDTANNDKCVIKVLKPILETKIKREVKVLRNLCGAPNVIALLDVVQDPSKKYHSLIMEHVVSTDWRQLFGRLTEGDIKHYTFQLLKALDFTHQHGIMHRDVKPGNVMIDVRARHLRLIDWGLAEFYHPGQNYHVRVGSRYYKAPELLVGFRQYDYSLDMWSVGCMFASMIFRREHFFKGSDNDDQLLKIMLTLGTEKFDQYLEKYCIHFETEHEQLLGNYPKIPWTRFVTLDTHNLANSESLDLLDKLLRYDHQERLTAHEAQSHTYFNSVRLEAKGEHISDSGFCST